MIPAVAVVMCGRKRRSAERMVLLRDKQDTAAYFPVEAGNSVERNMKTRGDPNWSCQACIINPFKVGLAWNCCYLTPDMLGSPM